jgi:hypothetical protein
VKQLPQSALALLLPIILTACSPPSPAGPTPAPISSARADQSPAARAQPAVTAIASQPAANQIPPAPGEVLLQQSGGGGTSPTVGLKTNTFTARGSWDLHWQYSCSALGRQGNLSIDVFTTSGAFISDPPSLTVIGTGGEGVQSYGQPGSFVITVNSVCSWSVSVTTSARPTVTPPTSSSAPVSTAAAASGGGAGTGTSASTVVTPAAAATQSSRGGQALQAIQPSIPTPRPAISSSLGAFAAPAARGRTSALATAASVGAPAVIATPSSTPPPTIAPARQSTPGR